MAKTLYSLCLLLVWLRIIVEPDSQSRKIRITESKNRVFFNFAHLPILYVLTIPDNGVTLLQNNFQNYYQNDYPGFLSKFFTQRSNTLTSS